MNRYTFGAIDIGSNAIRLLINYVEEYKKETEFKKAAFVRVPIRLGDDVFTDGYISDSKAYALSSALEAFSALLQTFQVNDYRAYATSAMREAKNGMNIVKTISQNSGIQIEIIDGNVEANTIYAAGGLNKVLDKSKTYLYVDVGGGSTEIVVYAKGRQITARSFKLGTVRFLCNAVEPQETGNLIEWLTDITTLYTPVGIIGSGGNINKAHKLLDKKSKETIRTEELLSLYQQLYSLSVEERMESLHLNENRADVIVPALYIFTTIAQICKTEIFIVPKLGLVDGIIRQLYANHSTNR